MKKWSWRIGRIAGIDLNVHATFFLLVGWVAISAYTTRQSLGDALAGVVFIICLFAIIVLHELGHALMARRFGIGTRDITLLPIGGVARLERMPEDPKQELLVALAGPAVNVVLALGFLLLTVLRGGLGGFDEAVRAGGGFLDQMVWVNVALVVFNMLPAFPMDGGRVLRALLALRMSYVRATQVAAGIGQTMAVLFGFLGLFTNPFLVLIAFFVWLGAAGEASLVRLRSALAGVPVHAAMITHFRTLAPHDALARAVDLVLEGFQQDFPVLEGGRVVGVLTRARLVEGLARVGEGAPVASVMERAVRGVDPEEPLEEVLIRLQGDAGGSLPVIRDQRLVGLLTTDNLSELLMIREALRGFRASSA